MNQVRKVTRLDHPGVLYDFKWPPDLHLFSRYNLIYGWNGSGKTTLSRFFRSLEQKKKPKMGEVTLCIDGREVHGADFPNATVPIRVFNRDFVNESVFPVDGTEVPPIFVVGIENVQKQQRLDRLRKEQSEAEGRLSSSVHRLEAAEETLDKHCAGEAKVIKNALQISGGAYNNYNKRAYRPM